MIISQILTVAALWAPWWSFSSKLWDNLKALQWAAAISALVLTIGAIIEYWKQLKLLVLLIGKWVFRRLTPVERCALKKLLLHSLGPILVVLGIAGDFVFEGRAFILEDRQEDEAQGTIASLKDRASANELKAAQFEKDAEGLKKAAEDEHLARVNVESAVAWRQLSKEQKKDIGSAVEKFSTQSAASLWFNGSSTEAEIFADDIAEALRYGHIVVQPPSGIMEMRESGKFNGPIVRALTGVIVQSTKHDAAQRFAVELVDELNRRGFDAIRQKDPPFDDRPTPQIWVNVEPRPKGPQGEFKLQAEREAKNRKATKTNNNR